MVDSGHLIFQSFAVAIATGSAVWLLFLCERRILSLLPETPRWQLRLLPLPICFLLFGNLDRILSLGAFLNAHPEISSAISYPGNTAWNPDRFFFASLGAMVLLPIVFTRTPRLLAKIGFTILWTHFAWVMIPFNLISLSTGVPFQN